MHRLYKQKKKIRHKYLSLKINHNVDLRSIDLRKISQRKTNDLKYSRKMNTRLEIINDKIRV